MTLVALLSTLVAACGGGGSGSGGAGGTGGGTDGGGSNGSVAEVLESFGVDTRATPRLDDNGEALPDDYSPLGTTTAVNRFDELALFGVPVDTDAGLAGTTGGLNPIIDFDLDGTNVNAQLLADASTASLPWFTAGAVRAAVAADIDADGLDEIVVAWQAEADAPVNVSLISDVASGGTVGEPVVLATGTVVRSLVLAADDLNGDGSIDIAVARVDSSGAVDVSVLGNDAGTLSSSGIGHSIAADGSGYVHVALATGSVDRDGARELAVSVDVYRGGIDRSTGSAVTDSSSRWFLLDDAATALTVLDGGQSVITTPGGPVITRTVDVALGDVDGDGVDEVVLGGLDQIGRQGDSGTTPPDYLIEIRDDARSDFALLASTRADAGLPRSAGSGESQYMYYLFVRTGDIDGDGVDEIVTNQFVWDDLRAAGGTLVPLIDDVTSAQTETATDVVVETAALFSLDQRAYYFSPVHVALDVSDVTGDGRDDIAFWVQRQNFQQRPQGVFVYGLSMDTGFREYVRVETEFANPQSPWRAHMLLGDFEINGDTAALRLSEGSYRYELTEPVVLAVLAAAPCSTELGQDLSSCRTGIGTSTSSGGADGFGWAFVANVSVGYDARDPITQSGGSVIARIRNEVRGYTSEAYRTTFSLLRETGPIEDTVVFTTVPYDIWSYEVLSHPDPEVRGRTIEVRLPRQPIEIMTTRALYNANTAADAFKIDERVLTHVPGDPGSYPTASQKNTLLQRYKGIEDSPRTVGLNTGRQTTTIERFTETTEGGSYSFRATVDVEGLAGGVVGGLEVGGGVDVDWSTTRGEGTIYQGQVAEIGPDNPISASYRFGLFAYIYEPGAGVAPFEVLNYWVDDF